MGATKRPRETEGENGIQPGAVPVADSVGLFQAVFRNSLDAMLLGTPAGDIHAANPAACSLFGMTEHEIRQRGRSGLLDPSDPRVPGVIEETARMGKWQGELLFRRKDGSCLLAEVSVATFCDEQGVARRVVVIRDRTEERRVADRLRESEARFRLTFDQSPIGAAIVSLDYRFVRVNERLCHITGYTEPELQARRFPDITRPDDLDLDVQQARDLEAGRIDQYSMEKRYIRKDGSPVWVRLSGRILRDDTGRPLHFLALVEDIHERRQSEENLRVVSERLALAARVAAIGIWDWDLRTNETTWDDRMFAIYGLPREVPMSYDKWRRTIHPEDVARREDAIARVVARGRTEFVEFRIFRPNGELREIQAAQGAVRDAAGRVVRVVGVNSDITEQKQTERERERLIEELRSALAEVKVLSGLLPICAWCKKIRDDAGYWNRIEDYIAQHSNATFTHGICSECLKKQCGTQSSE